VKVERQRWWGHLTWIFYQQPSKIRKWIAAGTATFLVKVKANRGEPANEGADILTDNAMSVPKVGKEWCQRTNRAVFTWKSSCREARKITCQDNNLTSYFVRQGK